MVEWSYLLLGGSLVFFLLWLLPRLPNWQLPFLKQNSEVPAPETAEEGHPEPDYVHHTTLRFLSITRIFAVILLAIGAGYASFLLTTAAPDTRNIPIETMQEIEFRLSNDPVYRILFRDFPGDKQRFIDEYAHAYQQDGEAGFAHKSQEMRVIMQVNHIHRYAATASDSSVLALAKGLHRLFKQLRTQDQSNLCRDYIQASHHYARVWHAVGDLIYLPSLAPVDAIIQSGSIGTQPAPEAAKAQRLTEQLRAATQSAITATGHRTTKQDDCLYGYHFYDELLKLPANEASLIIRHGLSTKPHRSWLITGF